METKKENKFPVALARLTQEETESLNNYTKKIGIKRSKLFRKIVREVINNEPDLLPEEMKEFKESVKQLAGMARNLNQLTRAVNSGKLPVQLSDESYFIALKDEVISLRNQLDYYIDATVNRSVKISGT